MIACYRIPEEKEPDNPYDPLSLDYQEDLIYTSFGYKLIKTIYNSGYKIRDIACDDNFIFVSMSDPYNNCNALKLDYNGSISNSSASNMINNNYIALKSGILYFAHWPIIYTYNYSLNYISEISLNPFSWCYDLYVHDNCYYVVGDKKVIKYNSAGNKIMEIGVGVLEQPWCVAVNSKGEIYISALGGLFVFNQAGFFLYKKIIMDSNSYYADETGASSIAIGNDDTVYLAINGTHSDFYVIRPDGSEDYGYIGEPYDDSDVFMPLSISVSPSGKVVVANIRENSWGWTANTIRIYSL